MTNRMLCIKRFVHLSSLVTNEELSCYNGDKVTASFDKQSHVAITSGQPPLQVHRPHLGYQYPSIVISNDWSPKSVSSRSEPQVRYDWTLQAPITF